MFGIQYKIGPLQVISHVVKKKPCEGLEKERPVLALRASFACKLCVQALRASFACKLCVQALRASFACKFCA